MLGGRKKTALLLGGRALREEGLLAASRIAEKTGSRLFCEVFPTRLQRGAGLPYVERIAYLAEMASVQLNEFEHLVLVDARAPATFFAYPGKKSYPIEKRITVLSISALEDIFSGNDLKVRGTVIERSGSLSIIDPD